MGERRMKKQTSAQILKKLTAFAIPLILSGMLQQLFNFINALYTEVAYR